MLSTEIRINGSLIAHLYVRNVGFNLISMEELLAEEPPIEEGTSVYTWRYYEPESNKQKKGTITHKRSDGALELVKKILEKC